MTSVQRETAINIRVLYDRIAGISAFFTIATGFLVLLGWALDLALLAGWKKGIIPMAPSTAIAFILLGGALYIAARPGAHRIGGYFAAIGANVVLLWSSLMIIQFAFGIYLPFEALLMPSPGVIGSVPMGRMSQVTAFCFFLSGLALLLLRKPGERMPSAPYVSVGLASSVGLLGLIMLIGYSAGRPLFYGGKTIPVALPTAAAFFASGAGVLAVAAKVVKSQGAAHLDDLYAGPAHLRYIPAMAVLVTGVILTIITGFLRFEYSLGILLTGFLLTTLLSVYLFHRERFSFELRRSAEMLKKSLEALENSEERFRSISQTATDAIITIDDAGCIVFCNDATGSIFGYQTPELVGKTATVLMPVAFHNAHAEGLSRVVSGGDSEMIGRTVEVTGRKQNGTEFPLEISLSRWFSGGKVFFSAIIRDVTIRKKIEEERENLIQQLQEALAKVRTLSGFLPICSSCKKIRNDKGYWDSVEVYIADHTDALFSHGICPECYKKLYPEYTEEGQEA